MWTRPSWWSKRRKLASGTKTFRFSWFNLWTLHVFLVRLSTTASSRTIQEQSEVLTSKTGTLSAVRGHMTGSWTNHRISGYSYHAQEGWRKVQIHLESVRTSHWYNIIPSISVKKDFLPRQGSPSLLAVWSADHPHPGSWGWNLAEGRAHPFPPQERGQETSLQV